MPDTPGRLAAASSSPPPVPVTEPLVPEPAPPAPEPASPGAPAVPRWRRVAAAARANLSLTAAVLILLIALGWAFFPGLFTSADPLQGIPADKLQAPSPQYWFGTDRIGRDVYARMVHGAGLSLAATLFAVVIALIVGSLIGLIAGTLGGIVDTVLMRIVDVLLSIPALLLSLALVTALGFGTRNVAIAVAVSLIAGFARVIRSDVLRVSRSEYVEVARASGVRWPVVLTRHILRNSYGPLLALAAVEFGVALLAIASLSFLGFGAAPPTPEWGTLISEGRSYLGTAWWLTALPGLVIVIVVVSAHRLGNAIREWDAR